MGTFFSGLSREYDQKMATLEMVPEAEGPQLVAFDELFGGISTAEHAGHTTITIRLGDASDLTLETPLRVSSEPFARGGGQVVEIEVADMPMTRLYLSESTEQRTGRGEIYGGVAERSVGQEAAPSLSYSDTRYSQQATQPDAEPDRTRASAQAKSGRPSEDVGLVSDFDGAGALGGGITQSGSSEDDTALADPPRDYIDASTRAAGIIGEANTGGGYGPPADRQPAPMAGSQDQARASDQSNATGDPQSAGVRLGIGLGGVRDIGGGSLGDRDLSGGADTELADLEAPFDMEDMTGGQDSPEEIIDLGRGAGVIDGTRDPIGGTGDEDNGMDESPNMVEGEVGAQAERDLTTLLGKHTGRRDPDDAQLQQRLTELIEEDDQED